MQDRTLFVPTENELLNEYLQTFATNNEPTFQQRLEALDQEFADITLPSDYHEGLQAIIAEIKKIQLSLEGLCSVINQELPTQPVYISMLTNIYDFFEVKRLLDHPPAKHPENREPITYLHVIPAPDKKKKIAMLLGEYATKLEKLKQELVLIETEKSLFNITNLKYKACTSLFDAAVEIMRTCLVEYCNHEEKRSVFFDKLDQIIRKFRDIDPRVNLPMFMRIIEVNALCLEMLEKSDFSLMQIVEAKWGLCGARIQIMRDIESMNEDEADRIHHEIQRWKGEFLEMMAGFTKHNATHIHDCLPEEFSFRKITDNDNGKEKEKEKEAERKTVRIINSESISRLDEKAMFFSVELKLLEKFLNQFKFPGHVIKKHRCSLARLENEITRIQAIIDSHHKLKIRLDKFQKNALSIEINELNKSLAPLFQTILKAEMQLSEEEKAFLFQEFMHECNNIRKVILSMGIESVNLDQLIADGDVFFRKKLEQKRMEAKVTTFPGFFCNPYYDYVIKIAMMGDSGVGKSNMILRYCDNTFTDGFISTLGVDFKIRMIGIEGKAVKLQIWDGIKECRIAHAIMIVCDLTDRVSYNNLNRYLLDCKKNVPSNCPIIIVGNKADLVRKQVVSNEELQEFAVSHNCSSAIVSAKTGENIERTFHNVAIARLIAINAIKLSESKKEESYCLVM